MSTLASVADFRASLYNDDKYDDAAVKEALDYAEQRFYVLTNRARVGYWFVGTKEEHHVHGTGVEYLRAPHPIIELSEIVIIRPTNYEEDITPYVRYLGHYLYYAGKFPFGFANIRLSGVFGDPKYALPKNGATVPPDVRDAVLRLAEMKLRRGRVAGERTLDRRPVFPGGENPPPPTITGDREVDGVIKSYMVDDLTASLDFR